MTLAQYSSWLVVIQKEKKKKTKIVLIIYDTGINNKSASPNYKGNDLPLARLGGSQDREVTALLLLFPPPYVHGSGDKRRCPGDGGGGREGVGICDDGILEAFNGARVLLFLFLRLRLLPVLRENVTAI